MQNNLQVVLISMKKKQYANFQQFIIVIDKLTISGNHL